MSMQEFTDVMLGRVAKLIFSGFIAVMMTVLTWAANSIKDEFHAVNDHLVLQDRELGEHTGSLKVIESNENSLLTSLKDSNASITSLAGAIAAQAASNAAMKQRMDDNDRFLKEIRPYGPGLDSPSFSRPR